MNVITIWLPQFIFHQYNKNHLAAIFHEWVRSRFFYILFFPFSLSRCHCCGCLCHYWCFDALPSHNIHTLNAINIIFYYLLRVCMNKTRRMTMWIVNIRGWNDSISFNTMHLHTLVYYGVYVWVSALCRKLESFYTSDCEGNNIKGQGKNEKEVNL